eukprot:gene2470-2810_t
MGFDAPYTGLYELQEDIKERKVKQRNLREKESLQNFQRPDLEKIAREEAEAKRTPDPNLEIYSTNEEIVISAEVPGVKKQDIDIIITQGVLTIRGEKKRLTAVINDDGEAIATKHLGERVYGRFTKSIDLPHRVDIESIVATHVDGVLTITIPKVAPEIIRVLIQ